MVSFPDQSPQSGNETTQWIKVHSYMLGVFISNFMLVHFSMVSVFSHSSPHPPTQPSTIAGSSLLNIMDQFALNVGGSLLNENSLNSSDRNFLNTDNIGMPFSSS